MMDERSSRIPAAYRAGYEEARTDHPERAANYVEHTLVGDPDADAVVEALAPYGQMQVHRLIHAAMEQQDDVLREAPPILSEFFREVRVPRLPRPHRRRERLLNVRFEEVLADPQAQIGRIIHFISPDLEDDAWLREAARIPRPARSRFEQLGAEEQALPAEGCRPGLERLGYPL